MIVRSLVLAAIMGLVVSAPSAAQESAYTRLGDCSARNAPAGFEFLDSFLACEGYGRWTVYAGATGQSQRLAYGDRNLARQLSETPITVSGAMATTAETIEWRTSGRQPYATIARWTARRGPARLEEYLVVSALDGQNGACHVAYVDVTEVSNANAVARQAADDLANGFRCGSRAPYRIGASEARRLMSGR